MKKVMLFLLLISSSICFSWSQKIDFKIAEIFPVESEHSYIGFSIRYMGYAMVRGRFSDFQGSLRYVEKDLSKTSVTLSIEVNSIDTGNGGRDKDLKSKNWFDAVAYPKIYFISNKAEITPSGLRISGDLTMRGITKIIVVSLDKPSGVVKDGRGDSQIIFTGSLTLNRRDFGVEGKNWDGFKEGIIGVSDQVSIELTILGKRINAGNFIYWVNDPNSPQGRIYDLAKNKGVESALREFEAMRSAQGSKVNEETLNTAGYMLLKENKVNDALVLFRRNVDVFPQLSMVYDSYAEGLATLGNWSDALKYYSLAIAKNPGNVNAREIVRHIQ